MQVFELHGECEHRYTPRYRPPCTFTLPPGVPWEMVERGQCDDYRLRTDLPVGRHRFGVVAFSRRLTEDERERFELDPV